MSAIFKMAAKIRYKIWAVKIQHCPISSKFDMWVDNDVPTLKISTSRHFQNGCHNIAKIQHCPISSKFDMWVDNDVPN
jgi:Zn ribbon nucleic-acid-binding protein